MFKRFSFRYTPVTVGCCVAFVAAVAVAHAGEPLDGTDPVLQAEGRRVEMIQRVGPSVVCLFDRNQRRGGGGSGAAMPGPEASTGEPRGG